MNICIWQHTISQFSLEHFHWKNCQSIGSLFQLNTSTQLHYTNTTMNENDCEKEHFHFQLSSKQFHIDSSREKTRFGDTHQKDKHRAVIRSVHIFMLG